MATLGTDYHQEHVSVFSGWYGGRKNGWKVHPLLFNRSVTKTCHSSDELFRYDPSHGSWTVLRAVSQMNVSVWWLGRAPWGYAQLRLARNFDFTAGKGEKHPKSNKEMTNVTVGEGTTTAEDWSSATRHLDVTLDDVRVGDVFNVLNFPAHVQGAASMFRLRIRAWDTSISLPIGDATAGNKPGAEITTTQGLLAANARVNMLTCMDQMGSLPLDSSRGMMKTFGCPLAHEHLSTNIAAVDDSTAAGPRFFHSFHTAALKAHNCDLCGAPLAQHVSHSIELARARHVAEGKQLGTAASEKDLHERGVSVRWLRSFTEANGCWSWPTWRVVSLIVKMRTHRLRCRYVELPGIKSAAEVGPASIFVSHTWSGTWGTLVAATEWMLGVGSNKKVWVDIFAVRQWPGNGCDLSFAAVIKKCDATLVVVGALPRVAELTYKDVVSKGPKGCLDAEERKKIPFFRVWCLVEIHETIRSGNPIAIACGDRDPTTGTFEPSMPLLYNMQFLIQIEQAEATVQEDQDRILDDIRSSVGCDRVNNVVVGAIVGALAAAETTLVQRAALGDSVAFQQALDTCEFGKEVADEKYADLLIAASACGYISLVSLLLATQQRKTSLTWNASSPTPPAMEPLQLSDSQARVSSPSIVTDSFGRSPLMLAVDGGHLKCAKLLLEHGANVNAQCDNHWTALMYGARRCSAEMANMLVEFGANPLGGQVEGECGLNAIHVCAQDGNAEACEYLLNVVRSEAANEDEFLTILERRDEVGYTALRHAAAFGQLACVQLLVKCGANLNARDNWSRSPIFFAAEFGSLDVVNYLLEEGCEVNFTTVIHQPKTVLDEVLGRSDSENNRALADRLRRSGGMKLVDLHAREGGATPDLLCTRDDLNMLMDKLSMTKEETMLALTTHMCRVDWTMVCDSPKPGDFVDIDRIILSSQTGTFGHAWGTGTVVKGDFTDDEIEEGEIGYIKKVHRDGTADVFWSICKKSATHKIGGGSGVHELKYAVYK